MAKVYGHRECKSLEEVVTKKDFDALKYAGSSSAGGAATSANKLNTNAGGPSNPVYFTNGVPVQCYMPGIRTGIGVYYRLSELGITKAEADLETIYQAIPATDGRFAIGSDEVTGNPYGYGMIIIDKWQNYRGVARCYRQDGAMYYLSCRGNDGVWSDWAEHDDNSSVRSIRAGGTGANNKWDALINLGLVVNNGRVLFSTGTTKTVFFEQPFTEVPAVILTADGPTSALYTTDVTKTGFAINAHGAAGNTNYTGYVSWLAITRERLSAGV